MSNGATAQDKLYSSTNDPVVGGSSSPAPMLEVVDVEAGKKGVPVILLVPAYNLLLAHGPRVRIAGRHDLSRR